MLNRGDILTVMNNKLPIVAIVGRANVGKSSPPN